MQNIFLAGKIFVNGGFGYPCFFGNFVNAGFMIAKFAEQVLRGTL
jgi:uncharacterized membrane protein (DUF4010 family)